MGDYRTAPADAQADGQWVGGVPIGCVAPDGGVPAGWCQSAGRGRSAGAELDAAGAPNGCVAPCGAGGGGRPGRLGGLHLARQVP